ncbi:MAG: hypothetical protein [Wendovervirus sonii]|uniref:Uncharacterized protein n=1 Tax=phage Lak_Megaphage_Sonny TaxID=3109229 RepID=A0ABZ0Z4I8_9CAUD|nr:MAG: hypothetical protein [phage Lak_Megaphage_Sonny]
MEKTIHVQLIIPMGLPGSGKTYYYQTKYKGKTGNFFVNFDNYSHDGMDVIDVLKDSVYKVLPYYVYDLKEDLYLYIDGLWLTADSVKFLINQYITEINTWKITDYSTNNIFNFIVDSVKIIHFDEDRENCLNNDRFRREESSKITIDNAPFDNVLPDNFIDDIKNEYSLESALLINVPIHKATLWETCFENAYLQSENWTLSGEWGNCWGAHVDLEAEEPLPFTEFENFIMKLCPEISHSNYTKLFNECCEVMEDTETGYYGSWTNYAYWKCDKEKLYKMMISMNLISEYLK